MGREGEKHQCVVASHAPPTGTWPATQACALTGNPTGDPLVCRPALSPLSHTSQDIIHTYFLNHLVALPIGEELTFTSFFFPLSLA